MEKQVPFDFAQGRLSACARSASEWQPGKALVTTDHQLL